MKTAVIYARYSSAKQTEQSIEGQLSVCTEYAQKNNIQIVNTYIDRAKSATTDNRPAFQQMLRDSATHNFDFVIVYALDRFARNDGDHGADKKLLEKNGVLLLSATQIIGINADGTENLGGILTEGIFVALAKYYSRELAQKVKRGVEESLKKGHYLGGLYILGFDVVNKKPVLNETEAIIVREMFDLYLSGESAKKIAEIFNQKGYKNKQNKPFKSTSIMHLLQNKRYTGIMTYGDKVIDNYFPIIINKEKFEKAQKIMKANKRKPASNRSNIYLLSGKLYCGYCNHPMIGDCCHNKLGNTYYYYTCSKSKNSAKNKEKKCEKKSVQKQYLEDLVVNATIDHILQPKVFNNVVDLILNYQKEQAKHSTLTVLKSQLTKTTNAITNIMSAIEEGIFTNTTRDRLLQLELEQKELQTKVAEQEANQPMPLTREMIEFWFTDLTKLDPTKQKDRQYIITYFVNKVILYNDKIVIIYNTPGSNKNELNFDAEDYDNTENNENKVFGFQTSLTTKLLKVEHYKNIVFKQGFVILILKL